jgi:hypothetical protein
MPDTITDRFVGTWRLVSYRVAADEDTEEPMGPEPQGRLIYEPGGRMMVQITTSLPPFASGDPHLHRGGSPRAFVGLIAYFGTYTVRPAEVRWSITSSAWLPGGGGDPVLFDLVGSNRSPSGRPHRHGRRVVALSCGSV